MSRRVEYVGPVVNTAVRITAVTHGGQIILSDAVYERLRDTELLHEHNRFVSLGVHNLNGTVSQNAEGDPVQQLWELRVPGLEGRFFEGIARPIDETVKELTASRRLVLRYLFISSSSSRNNTDQRSISDEKTQDAPSITLKEDSFLLSANLCRWIIDFDDIQLGNQLGIGSYGVVFRGKWKGVDVAVKKFIKQKLDERRMLEFRAEVAFLAELRHPNIVLFIG